jgi:hypothetical protein
LPPRVEEGFLELWYSALSENADLHKKMREFDAHWEYADAVSALNRSRSLLRQGRDIFPNPAPFYFPLFLWRELRAYGSHLNRVVPINRALRQFSENLSAAHTVALRGAAHARLGPDLGPIFEQLLDVRLGIAEFEKEYWDRVFCVGAFRSNYVDKDLDLHFHEMWMRRLPESLFLPELKQERNLDTTFQIRVGDLLLEYAPNPYAGRLGLLTVSRLVLLVYICAGLAFDIEGNLTIWGSDPPRTLTVDRTYETLRYAGLG